MPTIVGSGVDHGEQCCRRWSAVVSTIVSTKKNASTIINFWGGINTLFEQSTYFRTAHLYQVCGSNLDL